MSMIIAMEASLMTSRFSNLHILPISSHANGSASRSSVAQTKHVPTTRIHSFKHNSTIKSKIYEDHETGIVCYRSDDGKLICEGLDEGPRYQPPTMKKFVEQSRETPVHTLLGQSEIQLVEGLNFLHIRMYPVVHEGDQECNVAAKRH